jgi:flavodoxin I
VTGEKFLTLHADNTEGRSRPTLKIRIKMKNTIVVYGSTTGNCQSVAEKIGQKLGLASTDVIDVQNLTSDAIASHDVLLLGTSTWGAGEMQDDWYDGVKLLKDTGLSGKTVAVFGCGDSQGYSDTFCGGMSELYNAAKEAGATLVGQTATDGYTFDDSESVQDGQFVGLPIDEENESDMTDERIDNWLKALAPQLA